MTSQQDKTQPKIFLIAFEIAFSICFFLGIFWNPPVVTFRLDQAHHYYINRGLPIAWAGVSDIDKPVELPLVKAPLIVKEMNLFNHHSTWSKIIDLRIFLPLFAVLLIGSYLITVFCVKQMTRSKKLSALFNIAIILLLIPCIFFYFLWFPSI